MNLKVWNLIWFLWGRHFLNQNSNRIEFTSGEIKKNTHFKVLLTLPIYNKIPLSIKIKYEFNETGCWPAQGAPWPQDKCLFCDFLSCQNGWIEAPKPSYYNPYLSVIMGHLLCGQHPEQKSVKYFFSKKVSTFLLPNMNSILETNVFRPRFIIELLLYWWFWNWCKWCIAYAGLQQENKI